MCRLLDLFKNKIPSPKPKKRFITIPIEEYELLKLATWNKGQRAEAQKRLKTINAWKLNNGF